MKKLFILLIVFAAFIFISGCGDDTKKETEWENQDKEVDDKDSGNTGNTGDTGNTGNTGDTGNKIGRAHV